MTNVIAPTQDPAQAEAEIRPFRDRTAAFLKARGHGSGPLSLSFGPRSFNLDAQDREIVWTVLCQAQPVSAAWQDLLCSGVALQLGLLLDTEDLTATKAFPELRKDAVARIESTLTLARGVAESLQRTVDGLIATGHVEQAKQITSFKGRFSATLREIRMELHPAPDSIPQAPATAVPEPTSAPAAAEPMPAPDPLTAAIPAAAPSLPRLDHDQRFDPYIERLATLLQGCTREQAIAPVEVGPRSLRFTPWQRQVLWPTPDAADSSLEAWHAPLFEASAFQLAILQDLMTLDSAGEDEVVWQLGAGNLATTTELAHAVLDRLSAVSNAAIVLGDVDLAKKLTAVRNSLGETLRDARRTAELPSLKGGESARPEAASPKAPPQGGPPAPVAEVDDEKDELTDEEVRAANLATAAAARRRNRARRLKRRRIIMISCVAALAAIWVAFVLIPSLMETKLPVFGLADFQGVPALENVVARPPSLYVTVSASRWQAMAVPERERLVKATADKIRPAGYSGATFWTPEGRVVGLWLSVTGIRILPDVVSDGPPT